MKRLIAISLTVLVLLAVFCSCGGKLKGTYEAEKFGTGVRFIFSGDTVTVQAIVLGEAVETVKGSYDVTDTTIRFDFPETEDAESLFSGEYSFSQTDTSITIDGEEYKKVS